MEGVPSLAAKDALVTAEGPTGRAAESLPFLLSIHAQQQQQR